MAEIDLTATEHLGLANRLTADRCSIARLREDAEKLRARAKGTAAGCDFLDFEDAGGALHRFEDACNAATARIDRRIEQHRRLGNGECPECDAPLADGCEDGCRHD